MDQPPKAPLMKKALETEARMLKAADDGLLPTLKRAAARKAASSARLLIETAKNLGALEV